MKRFIGLFAATIVATALPLSAAGASPAPSPSDYQPGCDQLYNAGKPLFDAFITNAKPVAQPLEKSFCGDNKYAK
ncbi:MAG: hypothetical protein AB1679_07220 [Actinomycetota bacterium]|jgi:hypothetical protein